MTTGCAPGRRRRDRRTQDRLRRLCAVALLAAATAACSGEGESSLERGDRLLAVGRTQEALAEYELARRQEGDEPRVLLRLAHAYARAGELEESLPLYRDLFRADSSYRYQAASDLTALAREARERGGRDALARTLESVLPLGTELVPVDLRLELARYRAQRGEFERALPLFLSARGERESLRREDLFWLGRSFEELGGCREAVGYFREYLAEAREGEARTDAARWHYGNCLFQVARAQAREGPEQAALTRLDSLIELGVPRTLMDRAQYMRGDLLLSAGRPREALDAYRAVLRLDPTRSGSLAQMAEAKILEIRYR